MPRDTTRFAAYCALFMSGVALGFSLTVAGCRSEHAAQTDQGPKAASAASPAPAAQERTGALAAAKGEVSTEGSAEAAGNGASRAGAVPEKPSARAGGEPPKASGRGASGKVESGRLALGDAQAIEPGASAGTAELALKRLVVTNGIEGREPAAISGDLKANDEPVYAFVELVNDGDGDGSVVITFEHDSGKSVGHIPLSIPAKRDRWRTWGRTRHIDRDGQWAAVVRTADGRELGRRTFSVGS